MPRTRACRAALTLTVGALLAASLAGCASDADVADAADPDAIAARASVNGIAPDLVFTTDVDGYDLAPQSVGPGASDGMSATWFNASTGTMVTLRTDRGDVTEASCAATPLWDAPGEPVTCTEEDGVWHRSGGGVHEYVVGRGGAMIGVSGMGAPPEDLAAAARAVHVPSDAELDLLFSDLPTTAPTPVERGDLPENGDGAPIDPEGPGG